LASHHLAHFYPKIGRPSIDPVLMIRMLVVFAIRSERALCREVQVNLAYRWFCGLSIEDKIPDHSAFSRIRHERFRESDMFRRVFERVVEACIAAELIGGEGFAVDASLISFRSNTTRKVAASRFTCRVNKLLAALGWQQWGWLSLPPIVFGERERPQWRFIAYFSNRHLARKR
jgi:transposase